MSEQTKAETNKWICVVAYFIFFIPLLVDGQNEKYKFHANQGLNLLLLAIAVNVLGTLIPVLGWFIILPIGGIFCLVLGIMGILNAINEEMKALPIIGKNRLIK